MKLFQNLCDEYKERAVHNAEHIILEGLLENGFSGEPESPEDKEHFAKIQEALDHAKTLDDFGEKAEYLFENSIMSELIFDKAYGIAINALYIEDDEIAFNLSEINARYDDEDDCDESCDCECEESGKCDVESDDSPALKSKVKKDNSHLN